MAYAIMRCNKLKMGSAALSLRHTFREQDTPNADPSKTPGNHHWGATSSDEAMGEMRARLPDKFRKDAVVAVEYLFATSPEWAQQVDAKTKGEFFKKSYEWLAEKYGKENIFVATIHVDEKTPHMAAYVVPKTRDGRLSAKEMLGNRTDYQDAQTSFAKKVAHLGLERGIKGSKAKHEKIQRHYARVNGAGEEVKIGFHGSDLEPQVINQGGIFGRGEVKETPEQVASRLSAKIAHQVSERVAPIMAKAEERDVAVQKSITNSKLAKRLSERNNELTEGLSRQQRAVLLEAAKQMRIQNQQTAVQKPRIKPKGPEL